MTPYDTQNIFAKILRGEIPCHRVFEDESTLAFMDIMPRSPGHCLAIPKWPARNLLDCDPEMLSSLIVNVQRIAKAAKQALGADGVTLQQFSESAGGQEVFHLHFHILPRWEGVMMQRHPLPELKWIASPSRRKRFVPLWLRSNALGLALLLAAPVLAQSPPRGPSAEGIVLRLLLGYDGKALPQPERWPLVPRLRDALKRTDLGSDVLTGDRNVALTGIVVDMAEMLEARRARVIARYRVENAERSVIVDLDSNEGRWLITDIRPSSGPSFRQMLRLSR